jgi:uncharacterized membrane protein
MKSTAEPKTHSPRIAFAPWAIASFTLAASLLAASPAQATEWKICNASAEDAEVVIVYGTLDGRNYVAKGWWKVPANGGCKVVISGNLPVKGVYLHAEGSRGDKWEGSDLFCALQSKFELPNANNLNEKACEAKGGHLKSFNMHIIKTNILTTTLSAHGAIAHGID